MDYKARQRRRQALALAVAVAQAAPSESPTPPALSAADLANQRLAAALEQMLAEPRLVAEIVKASKSNWRAAAYLLERTYPERWARISQRSDEEPHTRFDPFAEFEFADELAPRRSQRHDGA
jgi:hypothetical protein